MESYLSKFKAGKVTTNPYIAQYEDIEKQTEENKVVKEKQAELDYKRELSGNPVFGMEEKEAVTYAVQMGATDTVRGIGQLFAKGLSIESLDDKLKTDYKKLETIFQDPEYGKQAFTAFLTSAISLDPVSYAPIFGWMKKAKLADTLWSTTKYAGKTTAVVGGLGYTAEDSPGLLTDENSGFVLKKLEQIGITAAAGMTLIGLGGGAVDIVYRAKTGKSIFAGNNEVIAKDSNIKLDEGEQVTARPLQVNDVITAPDKKNTGTIVAINEKTGVARVLFVNKKKGTTATKNFKLDDLQPPAEGAAKKSTTDPIDEKIQRPAEVLFVVDDAGNLVTRDPKTKTRYNISKAIDEKGKVIEGQWEIRTTLDLKKKPGESIANLKKRKTTITVVKSKTKAKEYVEKQLEPTLAAERKIPVTKEEIVKEVTELNLDPPTKDTQGILQKWEDGGGKAIVEAMRRNPIESVSTIAGAGIGYVSDDDPRLTWQQRTLNSMLTAGAFYGFARGGRKLDAKLVDKNLYDKSLYETVERAFVSDYGIDANHIARRQQFTSDKNGILKIFGDIAVDINKKATDEEETILYQLITGQVENIGKLHRDIVKLSEDGRKVITEYAQELVERGLLNKEVFEKNVDTYLKRSYLFHEARNLNLTKTQSYEVSKKVRLIGDELKPRGIIDKGVTRKKFEDPEGPYQKDGTWEVFGKEAAEPKATDKLTVRRQLTKTERVKLEEIENASYAMLQTGRLLANDVAAARYFDDIAADTNITLSKEQWDLLPLKQKNEYVQIPKTRIEGTAVPKFGKNLTGKYVQIDVANDIAHTFNLRKATLEILEDGSSTRATINKAKAAQTVWKKMKTVYNPATHVGNVTSNFMLLDLVANVPIKYLGKAIKEMVGSKIAGKRTKIYEEAIVDGIADSSLVSKELNAKGGSIIEKEMKVLGEDHGFIKKGRDISIGGFNVNPKQYWNYVTDISKKIKKYSADQMEDLYQAEDTVFRLATYMHRIDTGKGRTKAALDAKKYFVDYNINASGVNFLRNTVLPFVSYSYRAVPLVGFAAIRRPAKFAKWALGIYGVNKAGELYMEDDGKINQLTMRESVNKNMYGLPFLPKTNLRMPYNDSYGQAMYLDVQRYLPGGNFFESRNPESPGILNEYIPAMLQPGGIYWDAASTLAFAKDPFTGDDLSSLNTKERIVHFAERFGPNVPYLNPYSFASESVRKAKQAQVGQTEAGRITQPSPYTATRTPAIEILRGLGIRFNPQSEQVNMQAVRYNIDSAIADIDKKIGKNDTAVMYENKTEKEHTEEDTKLQDARAILLLQKAVLVEKTSQIYSDRLQENVEEGVLTRILKERNAKATGGLIEGEDTVPFTKQNPAERVNPFTGLPYQKADLTEGGVLLGFLKDRVARVPKADGNLVKKTMNKISVYNTLKNKELSKNAITGIMATIDKETGGTYDWQQEETGEGRGKGKGYGLFQLDPDGDHVKQYTKFLKRTAKKDSENSQIDYFLDTIKNKKSEGYISNGSGNGDVLEELFKTGTPEEITKQITERWERPGDWVDLVQATKKDNYGQQVKTTTGLKIVDDKYIAERKEAYANNLADRQQRASKLAVNLTKLETELEKTPVKVQPKVKFIEDSEGSSIKEIDLSSLPQKRKPLSNGKLSGALQRRQKYSA